jgi:predicted phosphodiesterase
MKNKFIVLSDIHFPYHDNKALKAAYKFLEQHPINTIILNGDILDFYDVSSFDKDPARINSLQKEIDLAQKFFKKLRSIKPDARIVFIGGNHDRDRLERYLKKHPELYSLDALKLPNLFGLDKFNIEFYRDEFRLGGLKIIHGDIVRKFSGYTARAELEKNDTSGISGHSHRLSCYYYRTPERYLAWYESGCLCRLDPEYIKSPNWSHGFLYGYVEKDSFAVTPIPIVDGKIKCVLLED